MPYFRDLPDPRRYNSLRLTGYDYSSPFKLVAVSMVTDQRRPVFADMKLAKVTLASLLSEQTLSNLRLRAFCLMPDHLHVLAGVRTLRLNYQRCLDGSKATLRSSIGSEVAKLSRAEQLHFHHKKYKELE